MWSQDRHQKIMALLQAAQKISTDHLADALSVSRETVRRDLLELEEQGHLKRVHGGAMLPDATPEEPFQKRMTIKSREKKAIGRAAVGLIAPGQTIFVDAGTTASAFAMELVKVGGITVITNSFDIATILRPAENTANVILLGGKVVSDVPGTYGELTLAEIARFRADIAILSTVSVSAEQGAADFDLHEAEVARAMAERARQVFVLADSSKLGQTSRVQYCPPEAIDGVVTDGGADEDAIATLKKAGIKQVVVGT